MAETTDEVQLVFVRQKAGEEDLTFGFGSEQQIREGENVIISMINAASIPYDSTRSVKDALDELFALSSS
jgi:hypothetical protein